MSIFQQRLVEAMIQKNINPKELEKISGIHNSCIYDYLNANCSPSAFTLGRLADALEVSMDWLWGRVN